MIRDDRFVLSRRQFAVDMSSLTGDPRHVDSASTYSGTVTAVWFRRRRGVTVACIGRLWDLQQLKPVDATEFLTRFNDGRYGGDCRGRWDGTGYWGNEDLSVQADHLAVLRPMLDSWQDNPSNPQPPAGFDGWWRF